VANLETYDNTDLQQTKAVFVPGIGCTINSVLDMNNVESTHGSTYDTAGLHRSKDPGSGAFTPYYGTHTTSVEPIEAGSEIFAAYGDTWIPEIPGAQVTFNHNLEAAESFLRDDYYRFVQDKKKLLNPQVLEGLWNFTRDFPVTDNQVSTCTQFYFFCGYSLVHFLTTPSDLYRSPSQSRMERNRSQN
jgi:hypothetical protein